MRHSIMVQLLVPFLAVLLGVVGAGTWAALSTAERAAQRQADLHAQDTARVLTQATFPLTGQVLQQVKGLSGLELFWIDSDGRGAATLPELFTAANRAAPVVAGWEELRLEERILLHGEAYRGGRVHLTLAGRSSGTLGMYYPETRWQGTWAAALVPTLAFALAGCGLAGSCALIWSRVVGRRVSGLVEHTRTLADGDFQPRSGYEGRDELATVGQAVNQMATQLAQYREQFRQTERLRVLHQLSGSLVHHLRNGLTGARLAVQLHIKEAGDASEPLQVALRQLQLMEERLRRVTDLTRQEIGTVSQCSLTAVLNDTLALLQPQAKHWHTRLTPAISAEAVFVRGDPFQLQHLAMNLMNNAMEAAGVGGAVEVHLSVPVPGQALLEVVDTGPGPPPELVAKLFEPFITGKPEGMGLGLAVVRYAAEQAGGTVHWFRRDDRTVFAVTLPCAENDEGPLSLAGVHRGSSLAGSPG